MVGSTTLEERFFSMKRYLGLLEYDQKQGELKNSFLKCTTENKIQANKKATN
jgi:hypothetical protein